MGWADVVRLTKSFPLRSTLDTNMTGAVRATTEFRPDIEGLRGIAVLLVVLYHARIPGFGGGYIGVDVFFVISGYLITGLLLKEHRSTGRINLGAFYARRARRLLPAAAVTVLLTLVVGYAVFAPRPRCPGPSVRAAALAGEPSARAGRDLAHR